MPNCIGCHTVVAGGGDRHRGVKQAGVRGIGCPAVRKTKERDDVGRIHVDAPTRGVPVSHIENVQDRTQRVAREQSRHSAFMSRAMRA